MKRAIDLASDRLRGYVLATSDQAFPSGAQLISSEEPSNGSGWRSKRRRDSAHDWAVLRLGVPGIVEDLVVDTTGQTGQAPTHIMVEGCNAPHTCPAADLKDWETLLTKSALAGETENRFSVPNGKRYSHLRLNIYPDGGVTRFHVFGQPMPTWMGPGATPPAALDLAAAINGGQVTGWSDAISSNGALQVIGAGSPLNEDDLWLTRRRRQPGNEWLVVRLCDAAQIQTAVLDTELLEGDIPVKASLEAAHTTGEPGESDWFEILPPQPMLPSTEHVYSQQLKSHQEVRWVRLNLFPDGGVSRLRLWGTLTPQGQVESRLRYLNSAASGELREIFRAVCHSDRWASSMALAGPFDSVADLQKKGATAWSHCREVDWREALAGHPRIGEKAKGGDLASQWSRGEQSRAATPDEALQSELREKQLAYEERFGFLFLICATGRTTEQILSVLNLRLDQTPEIELQTVAEELAKIIHLRLEKLLVS